MHLPILLHVSAKFSGNNLPPQSPDHSYTPPKLVSKTAKPCKTGWRIVASFPGLPHFCSSVCVQYNEWKQKSSECSSASVYYTERKPKNTNGGGFETRLGEFVEIFSDKFLHMTARVSVDNIPEQSGL